METTAKTSTAATSNTSTETSFQLFNPKYFPTNINDWVRYIDIWCHTNHIPKIRSSRFDRNYMIQKYRYTTPEEREDMAWYNKYVSTEVFESYDLSEDTLKRHHVNPKLMVQYFLHCYNWYEPTDPAYAWLLQEKPYSIGYRRMVIFNKYNIMLFNAMLIEYAEENHGFPDQEAFDKYEIAVNAVYHCIPQKKMFKCMIDLFSEDRFERFTGNKKKPKPQHYRRKKKNKKKRKYESAVTSVDPLVKLRVRLAPADKIV